VRKKISILTAALLLVLALSCVGQTRAGEPADAYEPNNTLATARALVAGTYALNFDKLGDVDCYNVSVQSGKTLTITLTNDKSTGYDYVQLNDTTSTILKTMTVNPSTSNLIAQEATYTGNYTVFIFPDASTLGTYTLLIAITSPGSGTDGVPGFDVFLVILSIFAGAGVLIVSWKKRVILKT
jgi:hypothetical protein